jgi:hypothetical protein
MKAGFIIILLTTVPFTVRGAALPEDYLRSIEVPEELQAVGENSEEETIGSFGLPSIFAFPLVRIIDANGDRSPDLLMLGDDIRIVLVKTETSNATLPSGNADPGGELRDCGEGNGAFPSGGCRPGIGTTITSATRSLIQVDKPI